jgi:hypothetical protein
MHFSKLIDSDAISLASGSKAGTGTMFRTTDGRLNKGRLALVGLAAVAAVLAIAALVVGMDAMRGVGVS